MSWRMLAASTPGPRHLREGRGNEDSYASFHTLGGILFAVADGAGSAAHAAIGSSLAVQAVVDLETRVQFVRHYPCSKAEMGAFLEALLHSARYALEAFALETRFSRGGLLELPAVGSPSHEQFLRSLACTFTAGVLTDDFLGVVQVGDGLVVAKYADGALRALTRPDKGEYHNETFFLTQASYQQRAQYAIVPTDDLAAVALMTDGIADIATEQVGHVPLATFFDPVFDHCARVWLPPERRQKSLENLLQANERIRRANGDDKTLLILVREEIHEQQAAA